MDALGEAGKIAKDHFEVFINFDELAVGNEEEEDEKLQQVMRILETPVEELELSMRASNGLKSEEVYTLRELTQKTEEEIEKIRNFGKKSLQEIKDKLSEWDLHLGMQDYSILKSSPLFLEKKEQR